MKTSGLPCRATHDCDTVFTPDDPNSVPSLLAAAEKRNAHELKVHDYRHKVTEISKPDFAKGPAVRRGRPKKTLEETIA